MFQQTRANPFLDDMMLAHEASPEEIDADWARHARRGMGSLPDGWTAATMWGQIYPQKGSTLPTNTRVQIIDLRCWALSKKDLKWHEVQTRGSVSGAFYRLDFAEDNKVQSDARVESEGSISVKLVAGRNYHFWPSTGRIDLAPIDTLAMASSFAARLIVDNPSLPDDRAEAKLIGSCGGDYWRSISARWKSDYSNNGDWAIGRFKKTNNIWRTFGSTNASSTQFDRSPPPLIGKS